METVEEIAPVKPQTTAVKLDCCLKCKNKNNPNSTPCSKKATQHTHEDETQKRYTALNNCFADVVVRYVYQKHHQYFYNEEPVLTQLIVESMNHLDTQDYDLERLEGLFRNLKTDLIAHFLIEETFLFPKITELAKLNKELSNISRRGIENIAKPIKVLETEHESFLALFDEIKALTNNYTPSTNASISMKNLYTKLEALHKNLEEHINIENTILYPKAIELEDALIRLR